MKNKIIRLLKALRYETIKRLPFILGICAVLFLFIAGQTVLRIRDNTKDTKNNTASLKRLGEDIKTLTEQNTKLSKQTNRLAKENQANIACIAKLFAGFINNGGRVGAADIDNCQFILATNGNNDSISDGSSSTSAQIGSSSSNNTSNGSSPQPDNSQSNGGDKKSPSKPLDCKIDLLGIHLGCP